MSGIGIQRIKFSHIQFHIGVITHKSRKINAVHENQEKKILSLHCCADRPMTMWVRLHGGSTKNDQTHTTDRVNNADLRNDLHFFVTSSRPIKAEPKGLKSATFGLQNLPEGGEIENNDM